MTTDVHWPSTTSATSATSATSSTTSAATTAATRLQHWYRRHQFSVVESYYYTDEDTPSLPISSNPSLLLRHYLYNYPLHELQTYPERLLTCVSDDRVWERIREWVDKWPVVEERTKGELRRVLRGIYEIEYVGWCALNWTE